MVRLSESIHLCIRKVRYVSGPPLTTTLVGDYMGTAIVVLIVKNNQMSSVATELS